MKVSFYVGMNKQTPKDMKLMNLVLKIRNHHDIHMPDPTSTKKEKDKIITVKIVLDT